jgi:hypothetical protein
MSHRIAPFFGLVVALNLSALAQVSSGSSPLLARPRDRISSFIEESLRATLSSNRHPLAQLEYDKGRVKEAFRLNRMILTLKTDTAQ